MVQAIVHLVSSGTAFDSLMGYGLVEAMDALVQSHAHDTALAVTYFRYTRTLSPDPQKSRPEGGFSQLSKYATYTAYLRLSYEGYIDMNYMNTRVSIV
jgi:hypothetical protein